MLRNIIEFVFFRSGKWYPVDKFVARGKDWDQSISHLEISKLEEQAEPYMGDREQFMLFYIDKSDDTRLKVESCIGEFRRGKLMISNDENVIRAFRRNNK